MDSIKITIEQRVNAIKPNSSIYKYYMNTPLNELKTRDEKLVKKELEKRFYLLTESNEENYDENSSNNESVDTTLASKTLEWLKSLPDTLSDWFSSASDKAKETYDKVVNILTKNTDSNDEISNTMAIFSIVSIWKQIKYFIDDDGNITNKDSSNVEEETDETSEEEYEPEEEENPTSESYNPYFRNIAYNILREASEEDNDENSEETSPDQETEEENNYDEPNINDIENDENSDSMLYDFAGKMIDVLLDDEKFNKYMENTNPELLQLLKDYQANPVSEGWLINAIFRGYDYIRHNKYNGILARLIQLIDQQNNKLKEYKNHIENPKGPYNDANIKNQYNEIFNIWENLLWKSDKLAIELIKKIDTNRDTGATEESKKQFEGIAGNIDEQLFTAIQNPINAISKIVHTGLSDKEYTPENVKNILQTYENSLNDAINKAKEKGLDINFNEKEENSKIEELPDDAPEEIDLKKEENKEESKNIISNDSKQSPVKQFLDYAKSKEWYDKNSGFFTQLMNIAKKGVSKVFTRFIPSKIANALKLIWFWYKFNDWKKGNKTGDGNFYAVRTNYKSSAEIIGFIAKKKLSKKDLDGDGFPVVDTEGNVIGHIVGIDNSKNGLITFQIKFKDGKKIGNVLIDPKPRGRGEEDEGYDAEDANNEGIQSENKYIRLSKLWNKYNNINKNAIINESDENVLFLKTYLKCFDIINESAKELEKEETKKENNNIPFDKKKNKKSSSNPLLNNIKGNAEEINFQLLSKAENISNKMYSDKDFIIFARTNDPQMLEVVKEFVKK